MKSIEDVLKLTSLAELKKEVEIRKDLIKQMVGTVYPSIVSNEIEKINERYSEIYWHIKENIDYFQKEFF